MPGTITRAYHTIKKKYIPIEQAENGEKCNCICLECGKRLVANQGDKNDWYFDHKSKSDCQGESPLHIKAKEIIFNNTKINVSENEAWDYSDAILEKYFEGKRPDVSAIHKGEDVFFEVKVTSEKKEDIIGLYKKHEKRSVEIFLDESLINATDSEIEQAVLYDWTNKEIIYPNIIPVSNDNNIVQDKTDYLKWILGGVVIFLFGTELISDIRKLFRIKN